MTVVARGTWVEIEKVLLKPEERASNLPEETRVCPYVLRVSGFLLEDAEVGSEVTIVSRIGNEHRGILKTINPGYSHSFGETVPELLRIGMETK